MSTLTLEWSFGEAGAHRRAMHPGADLTLPGQVRLVADLLDALRLEDVTLVHSDWGGALLLTARGLDHRLARQMVALAVRLPAGVQLAARQLRRDPGIVDRVTPPAVPHTDFTTPEYTQYPTTRDFAWETTRGMGTSYGYNRQETDAHYASFEQTLFPDFVSADGLPVWFTRSAGRVNAVVIGRPSGATIRISGVALPAGRGRLLRDDSMVTVQPLQGVDGAELRPRPRRYLRPSRRHPNGPS